jgi:chromosome condensin MukBEF complex kleisin-like MukF subunit
MVSENGSNGMEILEKLGATEKQFESRESHGNNALHSWVQLRVLHSFSKKQSENNTIYTHHHCHVQIAQVFQSFPKKQSENQCT